MRGRKTSEVPRRVTRAAARFAAWRRTRQIADAIRYPHSKRVIHRALGPQSILVSDAAATSPRLQIYNWQVGVREATSKSGRVTNVEDLVEAQAFVYMSPEAVSDSRKITEASDVFSLGAIA